MRGNNVHVVVFYSGHLKSGLIREVVFGGTGHIREVVFGGTGHIREVVFGGTGHIREVVFGGTGHIREVVFGGTGHIREGVFGGTGHIREVVFGGTSHIRGGLWGDWSYKRVQRDYCNVKLFLRIEKNTFYIMFNSIKDAWRDARKKIPKTMNRSVCMMRVHT